jgi:hypothetical protein
MISGSIQHIRLFTGVYPCPHGCLSWRRRSPPKAPLAGLGYGAACSPAIVTGKTQLCSLNQVNRVKAISVAEGLWLTASRLTASRARAPRG